MKTASLRLFGTVLVACCFLTSCGNNSSRNPNSLDNVQETENYNCGDQTDPSISIYNTWRAQEIKTDENGQRIPIDVSQTFREPNSEFPQTQSVYFTMTCNYPSGSVTAAFAASVTITANQITYNEDKTASVANAQGDRCTASVQAHTVTYDFHGRCVRFSSGKPSTMVQN